MKRSSTLPVALVILALSATAVTAAGPVYIGPQAQQATASHRAEATQGSGSTHKPEPSEAAESGAGAAASYAAEASHPANHGDDVSTAAHTATPGGADNHGQTVSSTAKTNRGHHK